MLTDAEVEEELRRLEPIAQVIASRYYWPGADRDDVLQVARLGLWKAIRSWDGRREIRPLARVTATRDVLDELRAATRQSREANRAPHSLHAPIAGDGLALDETLPAPGSIADLVEWREELRAALGAIQGASELEREALGRSLRGEPYAANQAGGSRSWDNACQRARARVRAALSADVAA